MPYAVAKMKRPQSVAETFIKPCALEMVKAVLGEEAAKKINPFLCQTMLSAMKSMRLPMIFLTKLRQTSKLLA